jgi:hypothetical protein
MALQQHAVPQHIASYEFRLVGDMTLKQFGYLAGGIMVAMLFYATPIPVYFRWPAIFLFTMLGICLAFVPIEDRPLSEWMVAFFKSSFAPTYYVWHKNTVQPAFLSYQATQKVASAINQTAKPALDNRQSLTDYLQTLPANSKSPLDQTETNRLNQISQLFQQTGLSSASVPNPKLTVNEDGTQKDAASVVSSTPLHQPSMPAIPGDQPFQPPDASAIPTVPPGWVVKRPGFTIDQSENDKPTVAATVNRQLPIPVPPSRPNIIVGMVISPENEIIENAILEIRNSQGIPVRALKTNQLGQFVIVTPLENGTYDIETEKEGYSFDIIKIEVKGNLIPPIEIRAKSAVKAEATTNQILN